MAKKKGNNYVVDYENNLVKIELRRKVGESLWTIIDLDDMDRVLNFPYTWFSTYFKDNDSFYAIATQYICCDGKRGKYKSVLLHQYVLGVNADLVDHVNHNTLDNRKENLRVIPRTNNSMNRKGRNKNNKSGYRNVSKSGNRWYVQLQINGKNTCLGKFPLDKLEEAATFAEEMRQKYYGEYAGNS